MRTSFSNLWSCGIELWYGEVFLLGGYPSIRRRGFISLRVGWTKRASDQLQPRKQTTRQPLATIGPKRLQQHVPIW